MAGIRVHIFVDYELSSLTVYCVCQWRNGVDALWKNEPYGNATVIVGEEAEEKMLLIDVEQ